MEIKLPYPFLLLSVLIIYVVYSVHLMYELKNIDPYNEEKLSRIKKKQRKANAIFFLINALFFIVSFAFF